MALHFREMQLMHRNLQIPYQNRTTVCVQSDPLATLMSKDGQSLTVSKVSRKKKLLNLKPLDSFPRIHHCL